MIIDFHTHIMHPDIINRRTEYCRQDACFASLYSQPKASLSTADELVNIMDDCEINKSVALNINWIDHELCIKTNDYMIESMIKYPDRIVPFISIQPQTGDMAIRELERCIRAGVKGVGEVRLDMPCFGQADQKVLDQLFDIIVKNNLVFLVHSSEPVGHQYSGKGTVTPGVLYQFVTRYPKLKIVCAHMGGGLPFYALMPEVGEALKYTYFDVAATPYLYKAQVFRHFIEIVGSEKLLFGSDYPLMSPEIVLQYMKLAEIAEQETDKILFSNATRLLDGEKSL
jgi:uncharacterized protein